MKKKLINSCIAFIAGVGLTLLFAWLRGAFKAETTLDATRFWCDGTLGAAVALGGLGLITLGANGGTFDMLAFGTKKMFGAMFRSKKKLEENASKSFADYRYEKQQNKKSVFHLLINGALFLLISIILLIVYSNI